MWHGLELKISLQSLLFDMDQTGRILTVLVRHFPVRQITKMTCLIRWADTQAN